MSQSGHPQIPIYIRSEDGQIPSYETPLASGSDLRSSARETITLQPMERFLVPTGLFLEIPPGYEAQVRARSGQAYRKGLSLPNAPGTIDADYRGELKVLVINLNTEAITIDPGERIAQLVIAPVIQADFQQVTHDDFSRTDRNTGGFGSTGTH